MTRLLQRALEMPNLRRAWTEVAANAGVAGVDEVGVAEWARDWEARLVRLADEVRGNRYQPAPLRERRIPKASGDGLRLLRIPTVTDRVLQRAVLQVLQPFYEPRFLDCSFGYRPGRGVAGAVRAISRLRKRGHTLVLDADIDDFFNQVDHAVLAEMLDADLPDDSLLRLIEAWNKIDCLSPLCDRGIPMGSPLSPLLANVVLHRLDVAVTTGEPQRRATGDDVPAGGPFCAFPLVRYADDFVVLASWPDGLQTAYDWVGAVLAGLRLRYEPHKTRLTSFDEGFDFLGVHFEENWYWYTYGDRRVEVREGDDDRVLERWRPEYE